MKNGSVKLIGDDSGAAAADYTVITIVVPILCIVAMAAVGFSIVSGGSLLSAPTAFMEMFSANLLGR